MNFGITIHFAGAGLQDAGADTLRHPQGIECTHHAGLDRLDRIVLIMNGRRRASEIEDPIDFKVDWMDDIMANEFEARMAEQVPNVLFVAGKEVVEANDVITLRDQPITQM